MSGFRKIARLSKIQDSINARANQDPYAPRHKIPAAIRKAHGAGIKLTQREAWLAEVSKKPR